MGVGITPVTAWSAVLKRITSSREEQPMNSTEPSRVTANEAGDSETPSLAPLAAEQLVINDHVSN